MRTLLLLAVSVLICSCGSSDKPATAQAPPEHQDTARSLREQLANIVRDRKATVGIAIRKFGSGNVTALRGDDTFAMMSVAKFPQALALLHLADEGKYDQRQMLQFGPADLKQFTGSTILKDHPQSSFSLSLPEALRYSIGQSDNITSNKIFGLEGGPAAVEAYVHGLGIKDIGLATDYAHMRADLPKQNWCTPNAMLQLLEKFQSGRLLTDSNQRLLWQAMVNSTSGPDRIKGGLPAGILVAHKTGTSGTNAQTGITAALNDVGIVQLPDGKYYGIAVFIGSSGESPEANAALIAAISKAAWDYFTTGGH